MKKFNLLLLLVTTFTLFSCDSQTIKEAKESATSNAYATQENNEAAPQTGLIAGHLIENDAETVYLLGPEGVKLKVNKSDIIGQSDWDESFKNLDGKPTVVEIKVGAKIKDGNQTHTMQVEKINDEPQGCDCEVSCGYNKYCCAISGFKTKCSGNSCIKTTQRC